MVDDTPTARRLLQPLAAGLSEAHRMCPAGNPFAGLKSPFDIVIDDQNRVWVSNS
jgi:hypothetical protein